VALCGDLCFLHDTNGLLGGLLGVPGAATIVVLDNDGGGIFSYLPPVDLPEFEELFGTPHGLDLVEVARAHGVAAERIDDVNKIMSALVSNEMRVIVVPVDRAESVERHRAVWDAVARAL
jgi:2-succinyl-5-enolpyruvyl-6-hydroxy-3-cyclohexene-1-carboxylate synthase